MHMKIMYHMPRTGRHAHEDHVPHAKDRKTCTWRPRTTCQDMHMKTMYHMPRHAHEDHVPHAKTCT